MRKTALGHNHLFMYSKPRMPRSSADIFIAEINVTRASKTRMGNSSNNNNNKQISREYANEVRAHFGISRIIAEKSSRYFLVLFV